MARTLITGVVRVSAQTHAARKPQSTSTVGVLLTLAGLLRYRRTRHDLEAGRFEPGVNTHAGPTPIETF